MQANVLDYYQADSSYHDPLLKIPEDCSRWISRLRADKLSPWLAGETQILEFGVGSGWNLAAVPVAERQGYDIGRHLRPIVEARGIRFLDSTADIAEASLPLVLSHHSLEHVPEPYSVLCQIRTWLRPGGKLLLYVPLETERRYRHFDPAEPNHHLYAWNPQTLGNLLSAAGFEVLTVRARGFGYERWAAVMAARLGIGELGFRLLNRLLLTCWRAEEIEVVARRPLA